MINAVSLYRQTLAAVNTAYDRTLLASAKSIGELLDVRGYDDAAELRVTVPYAALEAFEADNQSRMFYRVSTLGGEMVSGFDELPFWRGTLPDRSAYAALVDFYDDAFRGEPVRVAVLLQPVASANGRGMAVVQVAETLELRQTLTRKILIDTLWRQAVLVAVIAAGGRGRGAASHPAGAPGQQGTAGPGRGRPDAHRAPRTRRGNCCPCWMPPTR